MVLCRHNLSRLLSQHSLDSSWSIANHSWKYYVILPSCLCCFQNMHMCSAATHFERREVTFGSKPEFIWSMFLSIPLHHCFYTFFCTSAQCSWVHKNSFNHSTLELSSKARSITNSTQYIVEIRLSFCPDNIPRRGFSSEERPICVGN